jgi:hypothetical protein
VQGHAHSLPRCVVCVSQLVAGAALREWEWFLRPWMNACLGGWVRRCTRQFHFGQPRHNYSMIFELDTKQHLPVAPIVPPSFSIPR